VSVVDFWSVIWGERVTTIVMLTNVKEGEKVLVIECVVFCYWLFTVTVEMFPILA